MFFEDYKRDVIDYSYLRSREKKLSDVGIHDYTKLDCENIYKKVKKFESNVQKAKGRAKIAFFIVVGMMIYAAIKEGGMGNASGGMIFFTFIILPSIVSLVTYYLTKKKVEKPTRSEKNISERYERYKNNDINRDHLVEKSEGRKFRRA
ncbi:hypothetical protein NC796_25765 [Aliifodinibius sp. S!AR15-10]|uniref:hypothetical protein n=1 Tax=Aliifodinibius sp. S!AR15-10 TaxID=2950437 RepID=UPI00285F7763|nr:hypothetical protein [Aliifodinibius sp. S!AR15-10]MDR8394579.1 hypothetical protein [Aliifodinibius sp. S!AR15-10]